MLTRARVIGRILHCENKAIILMLELGQDRLKDNFGVPNMEHLFHVDINLREVRKFSLKGF